MRPPQASSKTTTKVMRANVGKNTKPELSLRAALCSAGLRGYRLNYKGVPGRPDIAYVGKKIAIFVNGCYWHRCPYCKLKMPKSNKDYWKWKFKANKERDKRKAGELRKLGWKVLIVWECQIKKDNPRIIPRIKKALEI